jgi:Tfp pilus assembly ATPase PilU
MIYSVIKFSLKKEKNLVICDMGMNLDAIIPREISQTQKGKNCVILFGYGILKKIKK